MAAIMAVAALVALVGLEPGLQEEQAGSQLPETGSADRDIQLG